MDIRRFEIIPILDSVQINDKPLKFQITCADVQNEDIYLGTVESFIFVYRNALRLGDPVLPKPGYRFLSTKKPIVHIKIVSVLNSLLCLTDQCLNVLNLETLEPLNNLKSRAVFAFCLNESPITENPFSVEICLVKRRSIQVCELQEDRLTVLKEISMNEQPLTVSMDGYFVCSASESTYYMLDWSTGNSQVVLTNDAHHSPTATKPMARHVARDEFLINGLSLGIFIKTSGISDKPPIDWGTDVLNYAHYHPFILCLKENSVVIISVIDSLIKEEFAIEGGVFIENFDGKILIASRDSVYFLRRIPFEEQIESLLKSTRTLEAIELCTNLRESGLISNREEEYALSVTVKAGLIELTIHKNHDLARQYLQEAHFDIRILLNCISDISEYLSLQPEASFDSIYLERCKSSIEQSPEEFLEFLIDYIGSLFESDEFLNIRSDLNTSLLLLLLQKPEENVDSIKSVLSHRERPLESESVVRFLGDQGLHHFLALFHACRTQQYEEAIDIWKRLERKQLEDPLYNGLDNFYDLFKRCRSAPLILKHVEFILERNQNEGACILIANTVFIDDRYELLNPDVVVGLLHRYRRALIIYLEHLVFVLNVKNPNVHTSLAILYIEMIGILRETEELSISDNDDNNENIVTRLNSLLHTSKCYDINTVLRSLVQRGHDYESAFLYGRLNDHRRAFEIYLLKHHNHREALKHCLAFGDTPQANKVCNTLLELYLELYSRNDPEMIEGPFLEFLNHSKCKFDLAKVLTRLPAQWPLVRVRRLVQRCVRAALNGKFNTSMGECVSLSLTEPSRRAKQVLLRKSITLDHDSFFPPLLDVRGERENR